MQRKWLFLILCAFKVFSLVFIAVFKSVFSRVVSVWLCFPSANSQFGRNILWDWILRVEVSSRLHSGNAILSSNECDCWL